MRWDCAICSENKIVLAWTYSSAISGFWPSLLGNDVEIKCKQVVERGYGLMQQNALSHSHPTYHNIASFYFIHALKKVKSSVNPLKSKICSIYKDEI